MTMHSKGLLEQNQKGNTFFLPSSGAYDCTISIMDMQFNSAELHFHLNWANRSCLMTYNMKYYNIIKYYI